MSDLPSWSDLRATEPQVQQPDRLSEICASVFTTTSGKDLLKELRRRYFENVGSPLADERALRVRATQQHFIRDLELACERGLKAAARASEK
jgi:hypothetical protein